MQDAFACLVVYPLSIHTVADSSCAIYRYLKWTNLKIARILSISDEIKDTLSLDIAQNLIQKENLSTM